MTARSQFYFCPHTFIFKLRYVNGLLYISGHITVQGGTPERCLFETPARCAQFFRLSVSIALVRLNRPLIEKILEKARDNTTDADTQQCGITSTKVLKLLSSICEWSIDQQWIESNPCRGIEDPVPVINPLGKQARPPSDKELRQLWHEAQKLLPGPPVRFHDFRSLINDQMSKLGVPTEIRSRTLHHTSDLQQLSNTAYSAYDFMAGRLRALELWEARLTEIVDDRKPSGLRW